MIVNFRLSKSSYLVFFLLCFAIPWVAWIYMAFTGFNLFLFYTAYSCSLAGLLGVYLLKGREGVGAIFKGMIAKAPVSAWLLVLFIPFFWQFLSYLIYGLLFNDSGIGEVRVSNFTNLFSLHILWLLTTGPLAEEFGWRGYLFPRFLEKYKFFTANVLLGIIWALWHLPIMYSKWSSEPLSALYFFVGVICFAMIIGLIYIVSDGNLLLCIVAHWTINASQEMMGSLFPAIDGMNSAFTLFSVVMLIVITLWLYYFYRKEIAMANEVTLIYRMR